MSEKRVFYGWKIVAASVVILAVGLGMFFSTNSLFVIPVCESFGVSRGQFTMHRTIITVVSACTLPFYGKAITRIGAKKILLCGIFMIGIVTFLYSFANSLLHFYILAFINGIFHNTVSFMVIGILIGNWFADKKGTATGLAFAGSGLGGAVMIPIVSRIIEAADWRFAYRFMGVFGIVSLVPVICLVIKDAPAQLGLMPYTISNNTQGAPRSANNTARSLSAREAFKTSIFWMLAIGFFMIGGFGSPTNTHSTAFLLDLGYPIATVSAVVAIFMTFLSVGKILLGLVYDRFGSMAGAVLISICCFIFPVAALLSHMPAFPWVYAVTVGIASCGMSVPVPILIDRYFGSKDSPVLFSAFTFLMTLSAAVSVPLMGAIFDNMGTYRLAWLAFMIFAVIISICMVSAEFLHRRKTPLHYS
ncbi:MAG: MFS transporter [Oscillospiraceae bacterium]|nr:MFS transporter [Oscillospiraceae bacterium]